MEIELIACCGSCSKYGRSVPLIVQYPVNLDQNSEQVSPSNVSLPKEFRKEKMEKLHYFIGESMAY